MSKVKITKGFDIRLAGKATAERESLPESKVVGLHPLDYSGMKPKLLVKEGSEVKAGTPVFFDKNRPEAMVCSPVSGKVKAIHYGERRALLTVEIENDGKNQSESFKSWSPDEIASAEKNTLAEELLKAGLWVLIRQRPFNIVADPADTPKAVFVSAMDTAPLAADPLEVIKGDEALFQTGLDVLKKFTSGTVNVVFNSENSVYQTLKNVEKHIFTGPHPAGNVGIHIHHVNPLNRGEKVWVLAPQDVVRIARFLTTGKFPYRKVVAVAGSAAVNRKYFEVNVGAPVAELAKGVAENADVRYISGDVLSGVQRRRNEYIGTYQSLLTIIPEGRHREFLGWLTLGMNKFSFSKTFLGKIFPKKEYALDTNVHGGLRAFIQTGAFEQVLPMDIHPAYLLRSILAEDIAEMEGLGIYEISEEDFALLAYIDPSKNDVMGIVRKGLNLVQKEA